MTRATELARHAVLGVTTAAAMLVEDPALLVVQASRRAPRSLARRAAVLLRRGAREPRRDARLGLAAWLTGHRDVARTHVAAALAAPGGRAGRRVLAEVAVELDVPDPGARGATAARRAWREGRVDDAVRLAQGTALGRRLASERDLMTPGLRLPTPTVPPTRPAPDGAPRALHVLVNSLPHTASGYALRSHAVLRAQAAAGVDVLAATRIGYPVSVGLVGARDVDVVDDVEYRRLLPWATARTPGARLEQHAHALAQVAARWGPTVLHTTTNYTNALVTQAVAAALGVPWVYEVRGLLEDTWAASFPTPALRDAARASRRHAMLRAREAELASAADHVVVLGATVRDDLVARGVDAARITVVPNSVDTALLGRHVSSVEARRALGLPTSGFWVGTVTSLVDYEGIVTLVDAVARLRDRGVDARAAVVGDGVARPAVERRVQELGLTEHVVLPGRVPPGAATSWYEALDAFAVPRRDTAVTRTVVPLKPMQAMALGRPVVASDLPALAEVVAAPGAGLLAAPDDATAWADALERLAGDDALAARLGAAGREFAAGRTWAAAGARYRALYEELAA
ncbi:glycosyltransferase [Cellulomonas iranensis]|uniref:D-inositol 3-phosphate glycosyltransferase n=1 Tax=Cellulomonas iranensis TaxID=76862 RepID=A0ABU0GH44_9CELL|nr:glycosyltransferase [Cellulomonas iranensis]MDQ0424618.1 glycosyltransferase involved in cell wall biosynthesis [Cellulomonas iranensis]